MFKNTRFLISILSVPLTLLFVYLSMTLLWHLFNLPSQEESILIVKNYFILYGLPFLFLCSFVEGLFFIGGYFPGGFVIFLSVILAGKDIAKISSIIFVVALALTLSYCINYALGRIGWYRLFLKFGLRDQMLRAQTKLRTNFFKALLYSYWNTSLASVMATASGILYIPFVQFMATSFGMSILWNTFWSTIIYYIGEKILHLSMSYILIILFFWSIIILAEYFISKKRASSLV